MGEQEVMSHCFMYSDLVLKSALVFCDSSADLPSLETVTLGDYAFAVAATVDIESASWCRG